MWPDVTKSIIVPIHILKCVCRWCYVTTAMWNSSLSDSFDRRHGSEWHCHIHRHACSCAQEHTHTHTARTHTHTHTHKLYRRSVNGGVQSAYDCFIVTDRTNREQLAAGWICLPTASVKLARSPTPNWTDPTRLSRKIQSWTDHSSNTVKVFKSASVTIT